MSAISKIQMSAMSQHDRLPCSFWGIWGHQDADSGVSDYERAGTGPIDGDRMRPRDLCHASPKTTQRCDWRQCGEEDRRATEVLHLPYAR